MSTSRLEHLQSYSEYLRIRNFAPPTIKSYLLGLRQFLDFRASNNIVGKLDQEQARRFILFKYDQVAKWPTINKEEVKLIIEYCKMYKYRIFISLLYSTGKRLNEAQHIKMSIIDMLCHNYKRMMPNY